MLHRQFPTDVYSMSDNAGLSKRLITNINYVAAHGEVQYHSFLLTYVQTFIDDWKDSSDFNRGDKATCLWRRDVGRYNQHNGFRDGGIGREGNVLGCNLDNSADVEDR